MKKLIATILTVAFLVAIVATPRYKVSTPMLNFGTTTRGNQNNSGAIFTQ